jgi:hypothetical protein
MCQEFHKMSLRFFSAASLPLLSCLLAAPLLLAQTPQASGAPASDDSLPAITVQIAPPPISISSAFLGVSSPLGAQPAHGKPMVAEFVTEHHQSFTDGNQISRATRSSIYRDAQGRIRRESQLSVPGLSAGVVASTFITIVDHHAGYGYVLDPQEMVAHRYELNGPAPSYIARLSAQGSGNPLFSAQTVNSQTSGSAPAPAPAASGESHWRLHGFARRMRPSNDAPPPATGPMGSSAANHANSGFLPEDSNVANAPTMRIDQPFLAAPNPVRTENLGEQTILGFRTMGTRVITTLPAGQIGNDRPIDIVSEQWFSPELELVMRSLHRDPWAGEFTTTVTRISRGDQAETLFEVPGSYKVIDAAEEREHHVLDGHGMHAPGPAPW